MGTTLVLETGMNRAGFIVSAALIFLDGSVVAANGQQDETQTVLAQCSAPAPGDIDSCLERARVLDETDPTPEIQALIGKLTHPQTQTSQPPSPQASSPATNPPPSDEAVGTPGPSQPPATGATHDPTPLNGQTPLPESPQLLPYQPPDTKDDPNIAPPDTPPADPNMPPAPPPDGGPGR